MIIKQLDIEHFGRLTAQHFSLEEQNELVLPKGLPENILFSFFLYLLYGPTDPSLSPDLLEEAMGGCILQLQNGQQIRITRTGRMPAELWMSKKEVTSVMTPGEMLLGVTAQALRATAFFPSYGAGLSPDRELSTALSRQQHSGSPLEDLPGACDALQALLDQLSGEVGSFGALSLLENRQKQKEEQLAKARKYRDEVLERENQIFRNQNRQKEAEAELQKFRHLESDFQDARLIREYDSLHEKEQEQDAREKEAEDFRRSNSYNGYVPDVSFLSELATRKQAYDRAKAAHEEAMQVWEKVKDQPDGLHEKERHIAQVMAQRDMPHLPLTCHRLRKKAVATLFGACASGMLLLVALVAFIWLLCLGQTKMALLGASAAALATVCMTLALHERYKLAQEMTCLFMSCLCEDEDGLWQNIAIAESVKQRLDEQEQMKTQAEQNAWQTAEQRASAYSALSGVAARWGRSLRGDGDYEKAVARISREAGDYIRKSSSLMTAKASAAAQVKAMRQRLNESSEVAVRARIAPEARARLRNLNEADLRHGVEHYEQLVAEYSQKQTALSGETELGENDPVRVQEALSLIQEQKQEVLYKQQICQSALLLLKDIGRGMQSMPHKTEKGQTPLEQLVFAQLSLVEHIYSETPPFFGGLDPSQATRAAWVAAGLEKAGQCIFAHTR